ncbi:MAG: LPS assembly lipoprotein LptE [Arcicella sp.]|nr:LPS assembly lipoprotein LptE [Arcicella sp.]
MILRKSEIALSGEQRAMSMKSALKFLLFFSLLIAQSSLLTSCYSFRGTSLDPNLKTIQIQNFQFQSAGGPPNLSLTFNEKIKEYFQRNTSLKIANINPDLMFEGAITGFEVEAKAPTSDDKGGLNRLTIRIQVKFTNAKDENKNYDQEFSFYQDFAQTQTVTAVQAELIPKILDQIVLDIFNKTAGEW